MTDNKNNSCYLHVCCRASSFCGQCTPCTPQCLLLILYESEYFRVMCTPCVLIILYESWYFHVMRSLAD